MGTGWVYTLSDGCWTPWVARSKLSTGRKVVQALFAGYRWSLKARKNMRHKILVVDDDSTLLRFLGEFLGNQNFDVSTAPNGPIALRTAFNEHPDLVVLDVMMPGMDGWEVTSRLREMSNIPIILLTAKNSEADKLRGFRLGVDDYITKPFSFAELTARIQAVLNRMTPHSNNTRNIILFGDIVLDTDKREARRDDHLIPLTPTEYRMLEVLAH